MRPTSPASAAIVNRTHRVVRARAMQMNAQKNRIKSLWIPLLFGGLLLFAACYATATTLADADMEGVMPASEQIFVLLMWLFPVSIAAMGVIWYKRSQSAEDGARR